MDIQVAQVKFAVGLFIIKDNQLLLLRRAHTGYADNTYALVGGKGDRGDTPHQTAIREAFEEVGIVIKESSLEVVHTMFKRDAADGSRDWILFYFAVNQWQGEVSNKEPEKHSEVKWFNLDALPENFLIQHQHALCAWQEQHHYSYFQCPL